MHLQGGKEVHRVSTPIRAHPHSPHRTFAWLGFVVLGLTGAVFVLGAGLVLNLATARSAVRMILRFHRARLMQPGEAPGLVASIQDLASRAGISAPHLAFYPSDVPNAFALATRGGPGVVAISTALPRILDGGELRGVLAHEIAHLRNRDSLLSLSGGLFVQSITTVSNLFGLFLFLLVLAGYAPPQGALLLAFLVIAAPYAARALHAGLMRTRERLADQDAALMTGEPKGLASALVKLERYNRYLAGLLRRFRFIYTTQLEEGPPWLRTHPSTSDRVSALLDLNSRVRFLPTSTRTRQIQIG